MKRFKFLGALFVGLIGLVGFSSAGIIFGYRGSYQTTSITKNSYFSLRSGFCYNVGCDYLIDVYYNGNLYYKASSQVLPGVFCVDSDGYSLYNGNNYDCFINGATLTGDLGGGSCTNYTSEECQQEYSLMPISSCDSEYCGLNGLCSEYTGSTMSELYINGINHLGAPIININIPLEQVWDYEYTGDSMNINLSGENNVDYEYMDNIIRTQNSKPNTVDFNNIISVLLPKFIPGLVIILFILFAFRFIKKIF